MMRNILYIFAITIFLGCSSKQNSNDLSNSDFNNEVEKYFKDKNINPCELYAIIGEMEKDNREGADKAFPNFGVEHANFKQKLDSMMRLDLVNSLGITDSIITVVNVYGLKNCE